jgi:hypothetical protein
VTDDSEDSNLDHEKPKTQSRMLGIASRVLIVPKGRNNNKTKLPAEMQQKSIGSLM